MSRVLKAHGVNQLPKTAPKRSLHTKRYAKKVPGHHVQVDVKFLKLQDVEGNKVERCQYTAIDDATRIRALRVYPKHNQDFAIKFIDYVVEKYPFRISTIRTDRGHEFQVRFHWYVEDLGMQHVYIIQEHHSIMVKWNAHTGPIKRNFINYWSTLMMLI